MSLYSVDLRWRAVWLHLVIGKSRGEVADLLFMSKRSVDRYISLYQSTGSVEPKKQRHGPPCILSDFEKISLIQSLVNKPTMYLEELQSELYELTGTRVHNYVNNMPNSTAPWVDSKESTKDCPSV